MWFTRVALYGDIELADKLNKLLEQDSKDKIVSWKCEDRSFGLRESHFKGIVPIVYAAFVHEDKRSMLDTCDWVCSYLKRICKKYDVCGFYCDFNEPGRVYFIGTSNEIRAILPSCPYNTSKDENLSFIFINRS